MARCDPFHLPSIALLPFFGALLKTLAASGVIKKLELPGGIKIELADVKAAADKVVHGWASAKLPLFTLSATGTTTVPKSDTSQTQIPIKDPIASIREIASTDSNLSLVAFRIEIEKRIREIAESCQIGTNSAPIGKLIRELQNSQILPYDVSTGLMELVALGNRAAHGVEVEPNAADWVLDIGSSIILQLDNILKNQISHNKANSADSKTPS